MNITRRAAVQWVTGGLGGGHLAAQDGPVITSGPFSGTRESLRNYNVPDWFRDAKFGIWAHWGPQSAAEYGDWYARNMYIQGHKQYKYHVEKYGHPSKFGFKDIIPTWKAEKFDAEALMALYKKAGAKYFVSMGVHHDNFDLWNSRHQHWNAVNMGPKKDIVGLFQKAARKEGLRFGVSEHLAVVYNWWQTSHGSDKEGPLAGVPYDGADPRYQSLYLETHEGSKNLWDQSNVPPAWKKHWFTRVKDLLDQYEPDLLYTDGPIFFEEWGLNLTAHLYNASAKRNGGKVQAVYANKGKSDCVNGTCVLDLERGVVEQIRDEAWQTDTCIGTWHYNKEAKYKTPKIIIDMLVDIVSRNGNLLLNFPLPSSGMLDAGERKILDGLSKWMALNGDAIYGTRPWKTYGSGPLSRLAATGRGTSDHHGKEAFNEAGRKELGAQDVRYVVKGRDIYAFSMGWDGKPVMFPELALGGPHGVGKATNVSLLGDGGKLAFTHTAKGLRVEVPAAKPCEYAVAFRVEGTA